MKPSFRHLCAGLIAGGALMLAASSANAGHVNWAISVGVPAPVVYAAPPMAAPVAYPAPVVYAPAPAPVVYAPAPAVYVAGGGYRHVHHHPRHWRHPHRYHY